MKVVLQPGETLVVNFADEPTHTVEVLYGDKGIQVHVNEPDNLERVGFVYHDPLTEEDESFEAEEAPAKSLRGPVEPNVGGDPGPVGALVTGARDISELSPHHQRSLQDGDEAYKMARDL